MKIAIKEGIYSHSFALPYIAHLTHQAIHTDINTRRSLPLHPPRLVHVREAFLRIRIPSNTCIHHACRYTEWVNRPDDGIDIAKALLAAAKANHVKIVDIILRKDNQDDSIMSVLHVEINGLYTWKIAVLEELSCIFEVCHIHT